MSLLWVHWGLCSHWLGNLLSFASPQGASGKELGATSDECCTFKHKHGERGRWNEAHLLLSSYKNRKRTDDKQTPCTRRVQQLVTQSANDPLETQFFPLSVFRHHPVFTILTLPSTSSASHFYWSKFIYFITFNLAYSKFLSICSTLKVFLVHFESVYHWFSPLYYPMIIWGL